jgi:hypothetical protein
VPAAAPKPEAKPAADAPKPAAERCAAVVKIVEGTVETRPAVGQPWTPVKVGDSLAEGADLRTGFRARCVLEMTQNAVQVAPLSVIRIGELRREGDTVRTRILLKQGNTESNVNKEANKNDFAIVTPSATLSVRGTYGVQAGFFQGFGGTYGLTGSGLTQLLSHLTGSSTGLHPGENSNDQATPFHQVLAQQFRPAILDQHGIEGAEQDAAERWHTSTPAPAGLGGSTGSPVINSPTPPPSPPPAPPPPPPDDYGGYRYGP